MAMYKIWFGEQYLGEAELAGAINLEFDLPKLLALFDKPTEAPAPRPLLFAARLIYRFSES